VSSVPTRPTISIVIPNFNHARLIHRNLQNLVDQTRAPEEVIVVDDGSTDDSVPVIESFRSKLPQLTIVRNPRNIGVNQSLNVGLGVARSAYVVSSAADDYLHLDFVEKMGQALEMFPGVRLCVSHYSEHLEAEDRMRFFSHGDENGCWYTDRTAFFSAAEFRALLRRKFVWLPMNAAVVCTEELRRLGGYDDALKWHADWFVTYAIAFRNGFAVVPEHLSVFRVAAGTYSAGARRRSTERAVGWAIYQKLEDPKFADMREALRTHPAAFSPFFHDLVVALGTRPETWPFVLSIMRWWIREFGRGRRPGAWRDFLGLLRSSGRAPGQNRLEES
jgi:glycosyltransferase involved in cell wall biosynthesis